MSKTASDKAREIVWQKLAYAYKTLSQQAIEQNFFTMFDVFDYTSFFGDWVISDTLFSSLITSLLFDIPLSDVVPWSLVWEVELPTPQEFIDGILIKLVPYDITQQFTWLTDVSELIKSIYISEYASNMLASKLEKGYYGKSRYGRAYYDPYAVTEFLRSTMYAFTKKGATFETARRDVMTAAKNLNIDYEVASDIFRRLSMMTLIKSMCATADYAWVDVSMLCEEGSEGHAYYIDLDGSVDWVEYTNVDDIVSGCWVYVSMVDYCYVAPDEYPFQVVVEKYATEILDAVDAMVRNFRNRITTTSLAVANYQMTEERLKPEESWRTESFGLSRTIVSSVEDRVEALINSIDPAMPSIKRRMYKVAALKLYSDLSSSNKWGSDMYKAMDLETLENQWVDEWSAKGLDRDVLTKIWGDVWEAVKSAASRRFKSSVRAYLYGRR